MKTKTKLLSLVLGIALSGILFTSCVKNEESDGVRAVREGYAAKLAGEADYQKALADVQRAEAEYTRLKAQWEKDEAAARLEWTKVQIELEKVRVELEKARLEHEKNLNDLEIAEKKAQLEQLLAQLEVTLQEQKNLLLAAQQEYALALINNEAALIAAKNALALAQANALANDPKLEIFQDLYAKLFVAPNYYGQRTGLLTDKLDCQTQILGLQFATNAEHLAWLKRDSIKAAESLKYAKELLSKYEGLDGLSVAELQAKADQAKLDWTSASVTAAEKNAAVTAASNVYNEENTKYTNENTKLTNLRNKLTTSVVQLVVLDSLYSLNPYNSPSVYPASASDLVNSVSSSTLSGYKNILNRANERLAYLKSEDANASQATGFGYSASPSDGQPTKKYLEEQIRYIVDVKIPAIDLQIAEQTAKVSEANTKLTAGKTAWASAESAYKTSAGQVNTTASALRAQLTTWKKAAQDSLVESSADGLTTAQQNAFFGAIKNYYVARYNFDRFVATAPVSTTYGVPTTLNGTGALSDADSFNAEDFFTAVGDNAWSNQLSLIAALESASNVKIVNSYEYQSFDGTGANQSVSPQATGGIVVQASFPASTSTVETAYVNSKLGALLYQSRNVYGAGTLDDIHYFLPYDTKRPTEAVNTKTPAFGNYTASLFNAWKTEDDALVTMKNNKANTFYIENYRTVLALVNRTIAFYEGLATEYGALVAETEAAVAAQQTAVNAQAKVREAAYAALQEATAVYTAANTHAANLQALYNTLSNPATGTLAIIKARIAELENQIGNPASGLIKAMEDANKALADYVAKGGGAEVIAARIAELEAGIKDIDAQLAALEQIIAAIEAQMQALLQQQ
jgi:hypothetical protein